MATNLTTRIVNSLKFHIWITFIGFTIVIFLILFLFQIIFYSQFYESMKQSELVGVAKNAITIFRNSSSNNYVSGLDNIALNNNSSIVIFQFENNDFVVIYKSKNLSPVGETTKYSSSTDSPDLTEIMNIVENSKGEYVVIKNDRVYKNGILVYGQKLIKSEETYYFYINSPLESNNIAYRINQNQLIMTSLISIIIGMVLSFFFSNRLSRPIRELNESAKMLAVGDFSVTFSNRGFNEVQELAQTLNIAKEEMQMTTQLQRELIANISHDLRTPLTLIKSYAEMIRDLSGDNPPKREKHLEVIITETDRLTSLVTDILQLSKIQSKTDELIYEEINLSMLVDDIIKQFKISFSQNKIVLKTEVEDDIKIMADKKKLSQVIYNFVSNAITYTTKLVHIKLSKNDEYIRFDVIDDGSGIDPEELDRIWERYYRAKGNHKRTKAGSGLGLSIVKAILDAHKFEFGVLSEVDKGSDFYFQIKQNKE